MTDQPTPSDPFEPAHELTITTLETLKVFSDPLRQQVIEAVQAAPRTVKQVATELSLTPTKLYYHVNLLEEHGLIRVTDTRVVSGIIEKHYRATARNFAIQRSLLSFGSKGDGLRTALDAVIDPIREEIERGVASGVIDTSDNAPVPRKLRLWRAMSQLPADQAEQFYARLEALVTEFDAFRADPDTTPSSGYTLLVAVYPTRTGDNPHTP